MPEEIRLPTRHCSDGTAAIIGAPFLAYEF
jgi:hypothetical protein